MPATRLIRYQDFTGGLNLKADAFSLGPTESPDMLNIDVDPRGGFSTRAPWVDWVSVAEAGAWDPRGLFSHVLADGTEVLFLAQDNTVWIREEGGSFADSSVPCNAVPHGADFSSWKDDCFVACGRTTAGRRWNGADSTLTTLTDPAVGPTWTTDPLSPVGNNMPKAEFVETHNGYLWVANIEENGTAHPFRVRWSLPNDPDAWDELDYIDIPQGGGPITGIASFRDHLLVFFPKAIYAIYGDSRESIQRVRVTSKLGAVNSQVIAPSEDAVYFVSWPEGVHRISGESIDEVSVALRPAFESAGFSQDTDLQWLSFVGQRLYWTVPFNEDAVPSSPQSTFVFDPLLGAWMLDRLGDGSAAGPYVLSRELGKAVAVSRLQKRVLKQDSSLSTAVDTIATVDYPFATVFRTPWFSDGTETIKKRWKRPDVVVRQVETPNVLDVFVYHDYDEANAKRSKTLTLGGASEGLWYADPEWDGTDASLTTPPPGAPIWSETPDPSEAAWGEAPSGAAVNRVGSLGSARAVQLEFLGPPGFAWGVNAIVYKYVLRRVR